ncbi:MAG: serine/threonine-protein kinase, partial [Phormidesmis sp.]
MIKVDANTGRKVSNRYDLIEIIGQGSMGKVYLADDSLLGGVPVAVKFLSQTLLNEDMRERFFREAMTCAQLGQKSMHVVRVTDYGVNEDDVPFYVMEYLKGDSVGRMVQKQPLPVPRFLGLVRQILLGLKTAHSGILVNGEAIPIIHRDIKPSNILVASDLSMGELVKILDFGIAKLLQVGSKQTSTFMGTLAYASPEQMEGRELDSRSDIYSLGIMMYQMLSGTLPIKPDSNTFGSWYKVHRLAQPKSLTDFKTGICVPKALEDVVMACLAKQREDRPGSVDDILEAIAPLEDRFGSGFHISQRINATLSKLPVVKSLEPQAPTAIPASEDDFCLQQRWPLAMPIAQIVFPQLLTPTKGDVESELTNGMKCEKIPTLWAMMPTVEIERRVLNTRYSNFMCTMTPHPMVLWLTAFYNKEEGPRWLPCYLDLKTNASQQLLWALADIQQYRILFFAEEAPHPCLHVRTLTIAASQRKLFQEWA